jgi:hypothetical protein
MLRKVLHSSTDFIGGYEKKTPIGVEISSFIGGYEKKTPIWVEISSAVCSNPDRG